MLASGWTGVVPAEEAAPGALLFGSFVLSGPSGTLFVLVLLGSLTFWFCWGLGGFIFHTSEHTHDYTSHSLASIFSLRLLTTYVYILYVLYMLYVI